MEKILYTVYRITNKINDNTYVGVHKTTDPNDGYMGSGTITPYIANSAFPIVDEKNKIARFKSTYKDKNEVNKLKLVDADSWTEIINAPELKK